MFDASAAFHASHDMNSVANDGTFQSFMSARTLSTAVVADDGLPGVTR